MTQTSAAAFSRWCPGRSAMNTTTPARASNATDSAASGQSAKCPVSWVYSYQANINVITATHRMLQRTIDILKA